MKNKLKLSSLEVKSFVTKLGNYEELKVKGGSIGDDCRISHKVPTCTSVESVVGCEAQ